MMQVERTGLAEDFRKSGQTQDAFCKENRINIHTLRYYLYKKDKHRLSANTAKKDFSGNLSSSPFISFPGSPQNKRYPVTIMSGQFTMNELLDFISAAAGKIPC